MSRRVLIVDDAEDVVQLLSTKLDRAGFDVSIAGDGDEALVQALHRPPDAVLVNALIPALDCAGLIRQLKDGAAERHPVIILISARASDDDILAGLSCGADDYILEPFSPNQVVHRIRVCLARRSLYGDSGENR